MSDVLPPQASPEPPRPDPDEPITGSFLVPASVKDVKNATTEITRYVASADVKWFLATCGAVAVGAVLLVGWFDARGAEKVAPIEKRVEKLEAVVQQQSLEQVRATVMLENLSRDRGLPVPPPAPKAVLPDGGAP